MKSTLTSTGSAHALFLMPGMSEPQPNSETQELQIYIGRSAVYHMPVLLDLGSLVNPHIAIVGATGSGKTYLLRSIVARFALDTRHRVVLIDWNGGYADTVNAIGGAVTYVERDGAPYAGGNGALEEGVANNRVLDICLASIGSEDKRRDKADSILRAIVEMMAGCTPGSGINTMVVVDEAWKLVRGGELQQLFREGRKYGFAIAVATQLTGDMSDEILSNAACRFTFRLVGGTAANLGVGSCVMSVARKDGSGVEFVVDRVDGFALRENVIEGGRMNVRISNQRFESLVGRLDASESARSRLREIAAGGTGTLHLMELVGAMVKAGLPRAEVVWFLREAGVDDMSIARACESASPVVVEGNAAHEEGR